MEDQRTEFRWTNDRTHTMTFVIEPWGDKFILLPKDEVLAVFLGPEGQPEVDFGEENLTVFGWEGTLCLVAVNGIYLRTRSPRVPSTIPPRFTVRSFVSRMFHDRPRG